MSFIGNILQWRKNGGVAIDLPGLFGIFGVGDLDTDNPVSYADAITLSSIWSAIQILSDAVAGLPLCVRKTQLPNGAGDGDAADASSDGELDDHPIANLLGANREANETMSSVAVKAALIANVSLWGNAYAVIGRDPDGQPNAIYPFPSSQVRPARLEGDLVYVFMPHGLPSVTVGAADVLHVLGPLTFDGITGLSPIVHQRRTVGLSLAMERFARKFFSQGGNVGGIIETPPLSKQARETFIEAWRATYSGPEAAFKIAALPAGYKFTKTTADPKESQSLESRVHQILEVSRIWRIPPHLLGVMNQASYASIEMQNMEFYQGTVQPICIRFEAELSRKLLAESEKNGKGKVSVAFNMDGKLRGTTQQRYAAYQAGRQGGWLSVNDVRKMENLPPVKGGDEYLSPVNMRPVGPNGQGGAAGDSAGDALTTPDDEEQLQKNKQQQQQQQNTNTNKGGEDANGGK